MKNRPALTLIELLIVVAIIAVISVPAFISLGNIRSKQALATSSENLYNDIKKAHIFARESRDDAAWGVVSVSNNQYVLKKRSGGVEENYESKSFQSPVVSNQDYSIWFKQDSGETDTEADLVISNNNSTKTIRIKKSGVIEIL